FSVDRGNWYKSNRYYPEDRLVMTAGRWPLDKPLAHADGSGWFDAAPLGRVWYEVETGGQVRDLMSFDQRFVPHEGTVYTDLDYGSVQGRATTWLHPRHSLLVIRCEFSGPVTLKAWMGPGVWVEEGWDTDPFYKVEMGPGAAGRYDLGESQGRYEMRLEAGDGGCEDLIDQAATSNRGLAASGTVFTIYFSIYDNLQALKPGWMDEAVGAGYDSLRSETLSSWRDYFAASSVFIPDAQFQYFYDAGLYHIKAMQSRESGGLPVNNLRRTWSSHIFWDSYFLHRALLEANRIPEALEGCRFFQRTLEHARRHAREEFEAGGLKWDWEITHDGRKAYGALLHMKFQIHNNASYANQIWQYYEFTRDERYLAEFYPILEGLAQFFLEAVVEEVDGELGIGSVVGVHESPEKVRNDGITVAGAIAILQHCADAARILGKETDFTRRCSDSAARLLSTIDRLFNGSYFKASDDSDALNMSSIALIYPMNAVSPADERARLTARAFVNRYEGRMVGHGASETGFPWAAGVLATVIAGSGDGDTAWEIIETTRPTICTHGGMTEVMENGEWNMQYFGTAEGAVCTALHHLLLQSEKEIISLFPALPSAWKTASFVNLLASGVLVTASFAHGKVLCSVKNIASRTIERALEYKDQAITVRLDPGETRSLEII
ncbi:MAG TPA: hypothetical protein VMN57_11055, partial [Anaerolineales bacterium]|nr:hypothetical protein [Anaerolineales bacterium]